LTSSSVLKAIMSAPTDLLDSLSAELSHQLRSRVDQFLVEIIRPNSASQFACHAPELAPFREAIAKNPKNDLELLRSFREFVPLTDYEPYKPFTAKFFATPCKEVDVENMFAPGLPYFLAASSATSGKAKIFPRYRPPPQYLRRPVHAISSSMGSALAAYSLNHLDIINIECENGRAPMKLAVSSAGNGIMRMYMNWDIEEDAKRLDLWGKPLLTRPGYYALI
jgi:hypothetical protein